jgi:hypothetical protein
MAMTLEYNGQEKSLADWGFAEENCTLTVASMEDDTFTLAMPGVDIFSDPVFPFEALVVIRSGRTLNGSAYEGGKIEFTGKRLRQVLDGRPTFEGMLYTFAGPWYDIRSTPYQQPVYWFAYTNGTEDVTQIGMTSDLVLFQKVAAGGTLTLNNGEQIAEVLTHLLSQYSAQGMTLPFAIGTIDVAVELNTYQCQDLTCSEVIGYCLRCSPDARLWFDYSQSPPVCNVTSRANCTAASVTLADGTKHEQMNLVPRPDLQARSVIVIFRQSNESNGAQWSSKVVQKYPTNGPDGGLRVIIQTVDLQGFSRTNVYGSLKTTTVANTRAWWAQFVPELQSSKIRAFTALSGLTVLDDDGNAVSLTTYPRALLDGSSIASWMRWGNAPVVGKPATVSALVSYRQYDVEASGDVETSTNGLCTTIYPSKQLSIRVTLTNGGTGDYSALASETDAEDIPSNLAQSIYTSLAQLQYEGTITLVEEEISTALTMANCLNLLGGRTEWQYMRAQIQSISRDYGSGRTTITVGPARNLTAGDLTQLFLINRNRRVWYNPAVRSSGQSAAGTNSVTLPKTVTRENSSVGLSQKSVSLETYAVNNQTNVIASNAEAHRLALEVLDSSKVRTDSSGYVEIKLSDCAGKAVKVREWYLCDPATGATFKARFLSSDKYSDA